ncbi:MAG: polysaccharide pyruvyl transferase family protein, partial [Propionicimonas sp.]|nr:polysaccharide pyruvyl transferase family protein [Propionicimonas sp.]
MGEIRRILVRSGKAPHQVVSPEAAFARRRLGTYAANAGNAIFTSAVYRHLNTPSVEVVSDGLTTERPGITKRDIDRINDEFDVFVLPMANSLRRSFYGGRARLTRVIRRLRIPVVVVGVGAQLPLSGDFSRLAPEQNDEVRDFVAAVLDHSASFGVRGEDTKRYLLSLGFADTDIDVIGCPSMHDNGRDAVVAKSVDHLDANSPVAVNVDHRVKGSSAILTENWRRYPHLTFVSQNQAEAALLMWGEPIPGYPAGMPATIDHPLYREDRIRFFQDPIMWRRFMAQQEFCAGSRLHGTIVALTAGTPAMLFAHDSRTREVAEYHGIPYRPVREKGTWDLAELYDGVDLTPLNTVRAENFDRYLAFIERNDLPHIFAEGNDNPEYAAQLEAAGHPEGIRPLTANAPEQIASRLRWLWQGVEADQHRARGAFRPEFEP